LLLLSTLAYTPGCLSGFTLPVPAIYRKTTDLSGKTRVYIMGVPAEKLRAMPWRRWKLGFPESDPDPDDLNAWLQLARQLEVQEERENALECDSKIVSNPKIMASGGDIPLTECIDFRYRRQAEQGMLRLKCCPGKFYNTILEKGKDPEQLLMAVKSLERVGTRESLALLQKFESHADEKFRDAARKSRKRIRKRLDRKPS
jgi:hypothetical protein